MLDIYLSHVYFHNWGTFSIHCSLSKTMFSDIFFLLCVIVFADLCLPFPLWKRLSPHCCRRISIVPSRVLLPDTCQLLSSTLARAREEVFLWLSLIGFHSLFDCRLGHLSVPPTRMSLPTSLVRSHIGRSFRMDPGFLSEIDVAPRLGSFAVDSILRTSAIGSSRWLFLSIFITLEFECVLYILSMSCDSAHEYCDFLFFTFPFACSDEIVLHGSFPFYPSLREIVRLLFDSKFSPPGPLISFIFIPLLTPCKRSLLS